MSLEQVKQVRELLKVKNAHLDQSKICDLNIIRSLYSRKLNIDDSTDLVLKYINSPKDNPYAYKVDLTSSTTKCGLKLLRVMKSQVPTGEYVVYSRINMWNPNEVSTETYCAVSNLAMEVLTRKPEMVKAGFYLILDAKNMEWKHFRALKPTLAYHHVRLLIEYAPYNLKNIVFYDSNWAMDMFTKLLKPLLPKKLSELLLILSSSDKDIEKILGKDVVDQLNNGDVDVENEVLTKEIISKGNEIIDDWKVLEQLSS